MLTSLATVTAEQQLLLKLQGAVVMSVFGVIAGYALRQLLGVIEGDAFIRSSQSRKSPWR
jgi:hypothetical protein